MGRRERKKDPDTRGQKLSLKTIQMGPALLLQASTYPASALAQLLHPVARLPYLSLYLQCCGPNKCITSATVHESPKASDIPYRRRRTVQQTALTPVSSFMPTLPTPPAHLDIQSPP